IVDPEPYAASLETAAGLLDQPVERGAGEVLGADLDPGDAGFGHLGDGLGNRPGSERREVRDRVERGRLGPLPGGRHHRPPGSGGWFRRRNRSMKQVESRPATNSGSRTIFRCSGIVVWIPSTTKKSRARDIRAIASGRVRSWTISFATSES